MPSKKRKLKESSSEDEDLSDSSSEPEPPKKRRKRRPKRKTNKNNRTQKSKSKTKGDNEYCYVVVGRWYEGDRDFSSFSPQWVDTEIKGIFKSLKEANKCAQHHFLAFDPKEYSDSYESDGETKKAKRFNVESGKLFDECHGQCWDGDDGPRNYGIQVLKQELYTQFQSDS